MLNLYGFSDRRWCPQSNFSFLRRQCCPAGLMCGAEVIETCLIETQIPVEWDDVQDRKFYEYLLTFRLSPPIFMLFCLFEAFISMCSVWIYHVWLWCAVRNGSTHSDSDCNLAGSSLSGVGFVFLIKIAELGSGPPNKSYKWHVSPVSWGGTPPLHVAATPVLLLAADISVHLAVCACSVSKTKSMGQFCEVSWTLTVKRAIAFPWPCHIAILGQALLIHLAKVLQCE